MYSTFSPRCSDFLLQKNLCKSHCVCVYAPVISYDNEFLSSKCYNFFLCLATSGEREEVSINITTYLPSTFDEV